MKQFVYILSLLIIPFIVSSQNSNQLADPMFVSLNQQVVDNPLHEFAIIEARIGNLGQDPIIAGGIEVVFSWSPLYDFVSFENPAASGFTVILSGPRTIKLKNTNSSIPAYDVKQILVKVKAVEIGPEESITGNVQRAMGQSQNVGNTNSNNDNAQGGQSVSAPLPVEVVEFTADSRHQNAVIEWKTATEINNDYFNVQRTLDGKSFETIGKVNGAGSTLLKQSYSFIDENAAEVSDKLYYRLEQVDFDGKTSYTNIERVEFEVSTGKDLIFPNPAKANHTIQLSGENMKWVDIYNLSGQVVTSIKDIENSKLNISTGGFVPGAYLAVINGTRTVKFVVK